MSEMHTVLLLWRDIYYIATYIPVDKNIVKVIAKKITKKEFGIFCKRYPTINVKPDILFDIKDGIAHILKVVDAELGRLTSDDIKRIYPKLKNGSIMFDATPVISAVSF